MNQINLQIQTDKTFFKKGLWKRYWREAFLCSWGGKWVFSQNAWAFYCRKV